MRHTCIHDDGGTPNRRCYACEEEKQDMFRKRVEEKPIDVAVRLAPLFAEHVPDDMCAAIFVFRKRDNSDEADIGYNANVPVGRLRAWLTSWLVEPDGREDY